MINLDDVLSFFREYFLSYSIYTICIVIKKYKFVDIRYVYIWISKDAAW